MQQNQQQDDEAKSKNVSVDSNGSEKKIQITLRQIQSTPVVAKQNEIANMIAEAEMEDLDDILQGDIDCDTDIDPDDGRVSETSRLPHKSPNTSDFLKEKNVRPQNFLIIYQ